MKPSSANLAVCQSAPLTKALWQPKLDKCCAPAARGNHS